MTELLPVRVVKIVRSVMPRRLTASDVIDACPDDKSGNVYAALSNLSKDGKGPLNKKRGDTGVLDYTISPGFDIDAWLRDRENGRRASRAPSAPTEPAGDDAAQIISVLRRFPTRLSSNDIEAAGSFADRREMLLTLAKMCEPDGPLERDRTGNGAPFLYGIRRGFDVEAWLSERGQELPIDTEPAPAQDQRQEIASSRRAADAIDPASKPASVAAPAVRVIRGYASDEESPAPRAAAPMAQPAAEPKQPAVVRVVAVPKTAQSAPASAPTKLELYDLTAELAIVAAANLAASLRDHVSNLDDCPELSRALATFERAERIHCRQPELRAEVEASR